MKKRSISDVASGVSGVVGLSVKLMNDERIVKRYDFEPAPTDTGEPFVVVKCHAQGIAFVKPTECNEITASDRGAEMEVCGLEG